MKIFTMSFLTGCLIIHGVMNYENEDYSHFRAGDCIEHYQVYKFGEEVDTTDNQYIFYGIPDGEKVYKTRELKSSHRKVSCPAEVE